LPAVLLPSAFYRLPHVVASGSWHMAADLALLEWVSQGPARLVFRTYSWDRPTLSLARTEPFPDGWDQEALARAGIQVVRRPTGGGAVLHVEEVTFALAASIPGPWGFTPRAFSSAAAETLSSALRACGLEGSATPWRARAALHPAADIRPGNTLCFARSDPGEIEARGYKVAGIASRFGRSGALCHASVPLTGRSRSVAELRTGASRDREALEGNARSVGELLGAPSQGVEGLGRAIAAALEAGISSRFQAAFRSVSLEDAGLAAPAMGDAAERTPTAGASMAAQGA